MSNPKMTDISLPFLLPSLFLRGRLVRLQEVSSKILGQHAYSFPVAKILSELLAAGATLSGLLKYEGVFALQTQSSGPISFVVVEVTHEGFMRGYAQLKSQDLSEEGTFKDLLGQGYLAFTVDQGLKVERYQGIVSLNHETLSHAIEHYFQQSEQLRTRIYIASASTEKGIWKSSALLLQQMPSENVHEETWNHMEALLNTLSPQEFLDFSTPCATLLYRLFHEVNVEIFDPVPFKAQCRCSKDRIKSFLATLSSSEIEELLVNGHLKIVCEFCNHQYEFERSDLMTVH
jgi:molecular chaperone Hsp33